MKKLLEKRKLKALKIAREKATDYAKAIDQSLGKALFIREDKNPLNNNFGMQNEVVITGYTYREKEDKIENLNLKSILISATIHAKFEIN